MKKIKLFFLAFLGVCLGLTSFSNASTNYYLSDQGLGFCFRLNDSGDCLNDYDGSLENITNGVYTVYYMAPRGYNQGADKDITYFPMNLTFAYVSSRGDMFFDEGGVLSCSNGTLIYQTSYSNQNPGPVYIQDGSFSLSGDIHNYSNVIFSCKGNLTVDTSNLGFIDSFMLFDLLSFADWDIESLSILNQSNYSGYLTSQSNLNQCLEDKNLLVGQVSTLSGSLTSCQSDLSDCRGGQDASLLACIDQKEQCETSLTTLSGNYSSLENMNSSLSSQLQECLENSSGSGDLICNKFDLFWSSDNTDYSFPINNDLILPPGYKGFVNEGVLAIKQDSTLESAFSIDDDDFQGIVSDFGRVFVFIFSGGLFVLFLFIIRKYFTSLFK